MKILFITPYPPLPDGLASYSRSLVGQLRTMGHRVAIISSRPTPVAEAERETILGSIGFSLPNLRRVYRAIKREQPDAIQVQYTIPAFGLSSFGMWAMLHLARRRLDTPIILTFHEVKRETALLGAFGAWYMRFCAAHADRIVVHTREAAGLLETRCRVSPDKINYVPLALFTNAATSVGPAAVAQKYQLEGKRVILSFGFIHVDKGIDCLLRAFALAKAAEPRLTDVVLVIAGSVRPREGLFKLFEKKDYAYEAELHRLAADPQIAKDVIFTPYVPNEEVGGWFKLATLVALPYTNLEQSGVLSQALSYRRPLVVSDLGGLGEALAGTQALVPPADDQALARKIQTLLTEPQQLQAVVGQYDRIIAERTLPVVSQRLVEVYQTAAQSQANSNKAVSHG